MIPYGVIIAIEQIKNFLNFKFKKKKRSINNNYSNHHYINYTSQSRLTKQHVHSCKPRIWGLSEILMHHMDSRSYMIEI